MGDQTLWQRLQGFSIHNVYTTTVDIDNTQNPKPVSLVHCSKNDFSGDVTSSTFKDFIECGAELYLVTVNQETSYIGREFYNILREILIHMEKTAKENLLAPKTSEVVALETSLKINHGGGKHTGKRKRVSVPGTTTSAPNVRQ